MLMKYLCPYAFLAAKVSLQHMSGTSMWWESNWAPRKGRSSTRVGFGWSLMLSLWPVGRWGLRDWRPKGKGRKAGS